MGKLILVMAFSPLSLLAGWEVTGTVYHGGIVTLTNGNWTLQGKTLSPPAEGDPFDFSIQTASAALDGTVLDLTDVAADTDNKVTARSFNYPGVFKNNTVLKEFIAPEMTSVGASEFEGCTVLTNVVISGDATSLSEAPFKGCASLSVFSPRVFPKMASLGGNVFDGCTALTGSFEFGEVTEFKNRVFADSGITMVKAPKLQKISATSAYPAFKNTPINGTLEFPLLRNIPRNCFLSCGLAGLKVEGCELVEQNGVSGCPNLEFMEFSNALTNIGVSAFATNPKLRSFKPLLPVDLEALGANAFQDCSLLEGPVEFRGAHVTAVPNNAFYHCTNLTSVVFKETITALGTTAFSDVGPSCSLYFTKNADQVPTFGSQCLEASKFSSPVAWKTRIYVRGGAGSAAWQATVAPLASTFNSYVQTPKADYPGAKAFGLIKTGYAYEIANSWIIDWPNTGFMISLH